MDNFTTRNEATASIVTAIEAGDAEATEYDIDAISLEVFDFDADTQRFIQIVDEDEFWAIVAKHQL